jgi:putative membrane protein
MMMFWWLPILILLVATVGWLAQRGGTSAPPSEADRAEAILRERYARGEIDEQTYRRQAEELRRS